MAPKKKGNKRQEEDWEAEMGESAPAAPNGGDESPAAEENPAGEEEETSGGGGLLAALRKNKTKKAKKGKQANDFVEGEDPSEAADFSSKQPEEGTFDDEDVFAGKKSAKAGKVTPTAAAEEEDSGFRVKSKKEKEKEKKEREKQRKKEQVRSLYLFFHPIYPPLLHQIANGCFYYCLGCSEEEDCPCRKASACQG